MEDVEHQDVGELPLGGGQVKRVDSLVRPPRLLDVGQRDPFAGVLAKPADSRAQLDTPAWRRRTFSRSAPDTSRRRRGGGVGDPATLAPAPRELARGRGRPASSRQHSTPQRAKERHERPHSDPDGTSAPRPTGERDGASACVPGRSRSPRSRARDAPVVGRDTPRSPRAHRRASAPRQPSDRAGAGGEWPAARPP